MLLSHWTSFSLTTTELTSAPGTLTLALPEFRSRVFQRLTKFIQVSAEILPSQITYY